MALCTCVSVSVCWSLVCFVRSRMPFGWKCVNVLRSCFDGFAFKCFEDLVRSRQIPSRIYISVSTGCVVSQSLCVTYFVDSFFHPRQSCCGDSRCYAGETRERFLCHHIQLLLWVIYVWDFFRLLFVLSFVCSTLSPYLRNEPTESHWPRSMNEEATRK